MITIEFMSYQCNNDSRMRKTWLLILEGFRQFLAATLVLVMLLPNRAPPPLGGSVLCFFSLISMVLFLSLQVIYWLHPKRYDDKKTEKVDETILLENGLRPELSLENRNGADAALQVFRTTTNARETCLFRRPIIRLLFQRRTSPLLPIRLLLSLSIL